MDGDWGGFMRRDLGLEGGYLGRRSCEVKVVGALCSYIPT
jgi:hypothetical protein